MMRKITVAAVQMACGADVGENIEKAVSLTKRAAREGANIILLPELFERPYFCQEKSYESYAFAQNTADNPAVSRFRPLAAELGVAVIVSFYEKDNNSLYNSAAVIDADGTPLGVYRKTHIPCDHFYQEKFYFTPGNTGFKVFKTKYADIGLGICWDQWFPETARCLALMGAELLFYPSAIGSEPILGCDSAAHWQRCMQGHAAANLIPVIASNRVGTENIKPTDENAHQSSSLTFYGSSFITDETGKIVKQATRENEEVICASFDLDETQAKRLSWGLFRDRRPECYKEIVK